MRILVIRFSSLGDVVIASAPILGLATKYPGAVIVVATKADYVSVYNEFPSNIRVVGMVKGQSIGEYSNSLGNSKFDFVVDLHGSLRARILTTRLKYEKLRRVQKHTYRRWRMVWSKMGLERPLSIVNSYFDAAEIQDRSVLPRLILSESERARVAARNHEHPQVLGIGWGAKHPTKAVPPELWSRLVTSLATGSVAQLKIFGLETDRAKIESFVTRDLSALSGLSAELMLGLPLRDAMVELASCGAFVSSDSGLMHVADALGVPTFGLFGPTHPALGFAPTGERSLAFHGGTWCSPCHRHGSAPCFRERRFCFDEIDSASVAQAITASISGSGKSR